MIKKWLVFLVLTILGLGLMERPGVAEGTSVRADEVWFVGEDFLAGEGAGVVVSEAGLSLAEGETVGVFGSEVVSAPLWFNALVPQWQVVAPAGTQAIISLRTRNAANEWSDWYTLHESHDVTPLADGTLFGDLVVVPEVDGTHVAVEFRIQLSGVPGRESPTLSRFGLTFIDSTAGPTADELVAQQTALDLANGDGGLLEGEYPKPAVVSREVWCTDPACDYTEDIEHWPVSHLILHHTVSSNSSSDWAATVRAIWFFHTFTRGWGDVGYNYLVDMNGVLYEGHIGGDDVVGTHASGANAGTMALSMMGTFTDPDEEPPGITPPAAMLNSAIELFSWKADQQDIDVYSASAVLPNVSWGLPHLMGHRDVYGTTTCPGEQGHDLLPYIKDAVAANIGFASEHLYFDEFDGAANFSRGGTWYNGPYSCGFDVHAYYVWSTLDPAQGTSWAQWEPDVPQTGWYEVETYAPYCNTGERDTNGARYEVTHGNGVDVVVVNQEVFLGEWADVGVFFFEAGGPGRVRLTNLTTTDENWGVWADAIRFKRVPPNIAITHEQPAQASWLNDTTVDFAWRVSELTDVTTQTLHVATTPDFATLLISESLPVSATAFTHSFSTAHPDLYWQIELTLVGGEQVLSAPTRFGLDTAPPTSAVSSVFFVTNTGYVVGWGGEDDVSGVASYLVEFRADGEAEWVGWLTGTASMSAVFRPPDAGQTYWFRSQATDVAGNVEAPHEGAGDINTDQAILLEPAIMLPIIRKE